jgi:hypothetical protein
VKPVRQERDLRPLSPIIGADDMMAKIKPDTHTNIIMCKLNFLGDRQVFQTRMGRLGFTIRGVRQGDSVAVFGTATTPHILRRGGGSEKYSVVGDAYVHGIMYGESDFLNIPTQNFCLV